MGARKRERMLLAANRVGKTWSAGMELAMHATGRYPAWWRGKRFPGPIKAWFSNTNNETTRDNPQRILLGDFYEQGTGSIPAIDIVKVVLGRGIADQVDKILVRHQSGGISTLQSKAYDQRREKWQGEEIHVVWFDEEPPESIYSEGLTRTNTTEYGAGITLITITPLLGMTDVVNLFFPKPSTTARGLVQMTLEDAEHFDAGEREMIVAQYKPHELEARVKGLPMLGSGRIFPVAEAAIVEDPLEVIPNHWPRIIGMDFGWDHPTAAVQMVWDREVDTVHLTHEYRQERETPVVHASAIRAWGGDKIPVAWPQDAYQTDKQSGLATAESYRNEGLAMLPMHAHFESGTGSYGREAGITEMLKRMQTGRWKVSRLLQRWLEEFRVYHRKDGKVVKVRDDLLDASRVALMMLRFASAEVAPYYPLQVGMDYDPTDPVRSTSDSLARSTARGVPRDGGVRYDPLGG